jgi:hypothetical protein
MQTRYFTAALACATAVLMAGAAHATILDFTCLTIWATWAALTVKTDTRSPTAPTLGFQPLSMVLLANPWVDAYLKQVLLEKMRNRGFMN